MHNLLEYAWNQSIPLSSLFHVHDTRMRNVRDGKYAYATARRSQLLQSIMPLVPHLPSFGQNSRQLLETLVSIITDVNGDEQVPFAALSCLRWTNAAASAVVFRSQRRWEGCLVVLRRRCKVTWGDGGGRRRCCWSWQQR